MPRCNAPFRLPTPSSVLEEHRLDPARHRRDAFRSGEPALDEYLRRYAAQQSSKGVTVVHVLVDSSAPQDVLGYYTLGAAELHVGSLAPQDANRLPRYPVPCFRMGRLAVAADRRGQGLGRTLLGLAVSRCLQARQSVAAYALIVDAKHAQAKAFYAHHGFNACVDEPLRLYLPLWR